MDKDAACHEKIRSKLCVLWCGENDDSRCGDSYDTDGVPHGEEESELDHCTTNWEVRRECALLRVAAGEGCHGDGDCIRYHTKGHEIQDDVNERRYPSRHRLTDSGVKELIPNDVRNKQGSLKDGRSNPK